MMPRKHFRCTMKGCNEEHHARGMCVFHYNRWRQNTPMSAPRRAGRRLVVDGKKQCRCCQEWKPLEEFVRCKRSPYGRASVCLVCKRGLSRAWRQVPKYGSADTSLLMRGFLGSAPWKGLAGE